MRQPNPERYRRLSEPFANRDIANESLEAFFKELGELREKHRIADVLVVVCVNVRYGETEGAAMCHASFGDPLKPESMAAYAYGCEKAASEAMVNKLLSGKRNPLKEEQ